MIFMQFVNTYRCNHDTIITVKTPQYIIRDKYILFDSAINYSNLTYSSIRTKNGVEYTVVGAAIKASVTGVNYYGTYIVCNAALPDSMVFNLTGLEKDGDSLFILYKWFKRYFLHRIV